MKKLERIKLSQDADFLNESAMKKILGGYNAGGTCGVNIWCGGVRVDTLRDMSKYEAISQASAFATDSDALASYTCDGGYPKAYWCCDSCN